MHELHEEGAAFNIKRIANDRIAVPVLPDNEWGLLFPCIHEARNRFSGASYD
jgi:hypothetical protein